MVMEQIAKKRMTVYQINHGNAFSLAKVQSSVLHGTRQNCVRIHFLSPKLVNLHCNQQESYKNKRVATRGKHKISAIMTSIRKRPMAGILVFRAGSSKQKDADIVSISASFGGGEENRTPVRRFRLTAFSERSGGFDIPFSVRPAAGLQIQQLHSAGLLQSLGRPVPYFDDAACSSSRRLRATRSVKPPRERDYRCQLILSSPF